MVDEVYRGGNKDEMNCWTSNLFDGIEQGIISGQLCDIGRSKGTRPSSVGLTFGYMADGGDGFVEIDEGPVK